MAKRYYLCDLVQVTNPAGGTSQVPVVATIPGVNWSGVTDAANGRALVIVAAANHNALRNRADVDPMPDAPLDRKLNTIGQQTLGAYQAALTRRGLGATMAQSEEYRAEMNRVGRLMDANFDVDQMDVSE